MEECRLTHEERHLLQLAFAGHAFVHLLEGVIPPLIPLLLVEFDTNYFRLSLIVTIFSYTFGLGALPAGHLIDRIGARRSLTIFLFSSGAASLLIFLVTSYWIYFILTALIGTVASLCHPAGSTLISKHITEKGRAFGTYGIGGSLGIAVAPIVTGVMASRFGWRAPHVLFGMVALMIGAWSLRVPRSITPRPTTDMERKANPRDTVHVLVLVAMFASFSVLGMAYKASVTFLPAFLAQGFHGILSADPVLVGSLAATIVLASGMAGQYLGGVLADRIGAELFYLVAIVVAGVLAAIMAFSTGFFLLLIAIFQAVVGFSVLPVKNILIAHHLSRDRHGWGFGMKYFMVFGVGSLAAVFSGYLGDNFGLYAVFVVTAVLYLVGAILAAFLYRYRIVRP